MEVEVVKLGMNSLVLNADIDTAINALKPLFDKREDIRVFVTGGTGFLGKWLMHSFVGLREALGQNITLTILSREPQRFLEDNPEFKKHAGLSFICGDIRSFQIPRGRIFDFVIHGATTSSVKLQQENPSELHSVIVDGTRHVLDVMHCCSVKKFLYVSSGAIYGPQPTTLSHIPETYEGHPTTSYGQGKKVAEQMCLDASKGQFDCVIARPFAFVGPYLPLDAHFAIGNFIRHCLHNEPITITGDGTPLRSYLYTSDLVAWLWRILLSGKPGRTYNIGSDEAVSILDLARLVREVAGTHNEIAVRDQPVEGAFPARYVPSVDRAKTELALTKRISLPEAIHRTLTWHHNSQ